MMSLWELVTMIAAHTEIAAWGSTLDPVLPVPMPMPLEATLDLWSAQLAIYSMTRISPAHADYAIQHQRRLLSKWGDLLELELGPSN